MLDTRKTQSELFAAGTWENLLRQWVKFLIFCLKFNLRAIPVQDATLAWYVQYLSKKFKSHTSVVNYLNRVKTLHLLLEASIAGFGGFLVKLTVRGLRRINKHQSKQALAINPLILNHLYDVLNHNDLLHVTFWAICLTSFFLLLRKSNMVVGTAMDGVENVLHHSDLKFVKGEVRVTLRWSKTNQFGEHLVFSLPQIPGSKLCPVSAILNMCGLVPGHSGVCFRHKDGSPFTYYQFHTTLRAALERAGYPAHLFSSHSFRRGGTTFSFLCGVPSELMKLLGGWRSDCYLQYLEFPMEARVAATHLMKHRIQVMNW